MLLFCYFLLLLYFSLFFLSLSSLYSFSVPFFHFSFILFKMHNFFLLEASQTPSRLTWKETRRKWSYTAYGTGKTTWITTTWPWRSSTVVATMAMQCLLLLLLLHRIHRHQMHFILLPGRRYDTKLNYKKDNIKRHSAARVIRSHIYILS